MFAPIFTDATVYKDWAVSQLNIHVILSAHVVHPDTNCMALWACQLIVAG